MIIDRVVTEKYIIKLNEQIDSFGDCYYPSYGKYFHVIKQGLSELNFTDLETPLVKYYLPKDFDEGNVLVCVHPEMSGSIEAILNAINEKLLLVRGLDLQMIDGRKRFSDDLIKFVKSDIDCRKMLISNRHTYLAVKITDGNTFGLVGRYTNPPLKKSFSRLVGSIIGEVVPFDTAHDILLDLATLSEFDN